MTSDPRSSRWPFAVLFDLDGTLIDSAPDIREALNEALAERDLAPFDLKTVRRMIGGGSPLLIERALDRRNASMNDTDRALLVRRFLSLYAPRATRLTTLLPGAEDALLACHRHGAKVALVTNKPQAPAEAILDHFGLLDRFHLVVGGDAGPRPKPAPDLIYHAADRLAVPVADCLFVGDSENDVNAAKAAGARIAAVKGGYTALSDEDLGADDLLATLHDLPSLFDENTDM
ncbi:phosphoglycolate phosphatase [Fulvimarina sp. 2208YS6-2-32]|uniref:phosphoglycolate phosphatase n=1 Tax=Fulvimarina uroteuthidis TaxID=3098149 RepID=A0ABU5HXP0_9HYPH|nr:phosphoglycolate phosphatase [Fulvimarina sp. 2208YS6-2-32]MDY8107560.1 phosphoglycolate phosphatase [Fulvimarina sp. 2208YS6-2-32]